jgi:hypothetical protein
VDKQFFSDNKNFLVMIGKDNLNWLEKLYNKIITQNGWSVPEEFNKQILMTRIEEYFNALYKGSMDIENMNIDVAI